MIALILLNKTSWHLSVWCNWKYCYTYSLHQHLTSFPTAKFVFTKVPPTKSCNPPLKILPPPALGKCFAMGNLTMSFWVMPCNWILGELISDECKSIEHRAEFGQLRFMWFEFTWLKSAIVPIQKQWIQVRVVLPSDPLVGGGSHVVIIGALPIVGPDLQPAPDPFLQLGLLCWCWCHPGGVWGTLVGTGHGQSGGCVRKTSTKSFSFCYVFGSFGGFSSGQLYISSTFQVLFGSQVWGVQVGLVWGTEGVTTRP